MNGAASSLSRAELTILVKKDDFSCIAYGYHTLFWVDRIFCYRELTLGQAKERKKTVETLGSFCGNRRKESRPNSTQGLLTIEQYEDLDERLQSPPADGGIWTGPKVAKAPSEMTGREHV